jgi:hypothetical protein
MQKTKAVNIPCLCHPVTNDNILLAVTNENNCGVYEDPNPFRHLKVM